MRFSGEIGFGFPAEKSKGVWEDQITEHIYRGDVTQNTQTMSLGDNILTENAFQTTISVVADAYALENWQAIKYVKWAGSLWTVRSVQTRRPRLILMIGEVYRGPTA